MVVMSVPPCNHNLLRPTDTDSDGTGGGCIRLVALSVIQEAHCARCASAMPADANFCRYCGQQRGKKVIQVKNHGQRPRVGC